VDLKLQHKRALVTGSTSGIGEAIAKTLSQEGVKVVVHGRREVEAKRVVEEIAKAGGTATYAIGDIATDAGADHVSAAAIQAFGGIDILVNNAGTYPAKGWFEESADDWNDVYNVNVATMVRMINRLVPLMQERQWGRVIAIASGVGTKPQGGMPAYSATKVANINLAVSLAMTLADSGVTSNAVSPGIILTPGLHYMFDKMGVDSNLEVRAKMAADFAPNPAGRAGYPQEIADAVVFLASGRADYITGQNLRVDGGYVPTVN
jgi:NAD(P)-dependent dehydrogenase (short-subunit alcohol dehydrogenase family)